MTLRGNGDYMQNGATKRRQTSVVLVHLTAHRLDSGILCATHHNAARKKIDGGLRAFSLCV